MNRDLVSLVGTATLGTGIAAASMLGSFIITLVAIDLWYTVYGHVRNRYE